MQTLQDLGSLGGNMWQYLPDHIKRLLMAQQGMNPMMGQPNQQQQMLNPMLLAMGPTDVMSPRDQAAYLAATGETISGRRPMQAAAPEAQYAPGGGVGVHREGVVNPFYGWQPSQISKYQSLISAGVPPNVARQRVGR